MYVCLCSNVTDSQIKQAAKKGVCSMQQLCNELGIAKQCGKCGTCAREIFQEACNEITVHDPQQDR